MKKSSMFITLSILFLMSAINIVVVTTVANDVKEKIDVVKHNLYLVKGYLTAYKSDVNEMLLATSDRVTKYVEDMDVMKSELYTSILSSAQATNSKIDSLVADLKGMRNIIPKNQCSENFNYIIVHVKNIYTY